MKKLSVLIALLSIISSAKSQILSPASWSYASKKLNKTEAIVFVKATIDHGWHIYSIHQPDGGPLKTTIKFEPSAGFSLTGKLMEPKPHTEFNDIWGINVLSFEDSVTFQQKIELKKGLTTVKGSITFMACNDHQCLPPQTVEFYIPIK